MSDNYSIDAGEAYYDKNQAQLTDLVENIWMNSPVGSIDQAIGNTAFGLNHRQTPASIGINRDYFGLTFYTRPRLNLSTENLRAWREFNPLLTNQPQSWQRIIRCYLDPTLEESQGISSPFVDPQQAFIPLLTNHSLSSTGWPDLEALTYTSHEGVGRESMSFVDSIISLNGTYDIVGTFRNLPGDPILLLFYAWLYYQSKVYLGDIIPYPDALIANEIDYMTRIYRLVLDPSRRFVTKIAATGASFPLNVPFGAAINHDADHPINMSNAQLTFQFRSNTIHYNDPILIDEFNRTVALFNDGMASNRFTASVDQQTGLTVYSNTEFIQIPYNLLFLFNNRGYPRIIPETLELTWWVDRQEYTSRLGQAT